MRSNSASAVHGSGNSADARAGREREQQVRAGGVSEVELRHRERDVVLAVADHAAARSTRWCSRTSGGSGPPPWRARGAAREQPDRRVVAVESGRSRASAGRGDSTRARTPRFRSTTTRSGPRRLARGRARTRPALSRCTISARARVYSSRWRSRARAAPGFTITTTAPSLSVAEQRRDELRAVGQRDQHALLGLDAARCQQAAEPVRERLHLGVGQRRLRRCAARCVRRVLRERARRGSSPRCSSVSEGSVGMVGFPLRRPIIHARRAGGKPFPGETGAVSDPPAGRADVGGGAATWIARAPSRCCRAARSRRTARTCRSRPTS